MATFSKQLLSGGVNGRPIAVAATATPGTVLHTAHATDLDEITLFACNTTGASVELTIEWGGVTTGDRTVVTLPSKEGDVLIAAGKLLTGGLVVRAFAPAGININGFVNRITP